MLPNFRTGSPFSAFDTEVYALQMFWKTSGYPVHGLDCEVNTMLHICNNEKQSPDRTLFHKWWRCEESNPAENIYFSGFRFLC